MVHTSATEAAPAHLLVEKARVLAVLIDVGVRLLREGERVLVTRARNDNVALEGRPVAENRLVLRATWWSFAVVCEKNSRTHKKIKIKNTVLLLLYSSIVPYGAHDKEAVPNSRVTVKITTQYYNTQRSPSSGVSSLSCASSQVSSKIRCYVKADDFFAFVVLLSPSCPPSFPDTRPAGRCLTSASSKPPRCNEVPRSTIASTKPAFLQPNLLKAEVLCLRLSSAIFFSTRASSSAGPMDATKRFDCFFFFFFSHFIKNIVCFFRFFEAVVGERQGEVGDSTARTTDAEGLGKSDKGESTHGTYGVSPQTLHLGRMAIVCVNMLR